MIDAFARCGTQTARRCSRESLLSALAVASALVACLPLNELSDYSNADPADPGGGAAIEGSEAAALGPEDGVTLSAVETVVPPAPAASTVSEQPSPRAVIEQLGPREQGPGVAEADRSPGDGATDERVAAPDAGISPPAGSEERSARRCARNESSGPNGDCYALLATALNWRAARTSCRGRGPGWDLASIRSAADNEFLRQLDREQVWVGGSDATSEGTWVWVDDGAPFWQGEASGSASQGAFFSWSGDEPNGAATSDCLRLRPNGRWGDFECAELLGSICEGPSR